MNCAPVMLPITRTGMQRMMSPENNLARFNQSSEIFIFIFILSVFDNI